MPEQVRHDEGFEGRSEIVERCGLMRGRGHCVMRLEETRNISPSPADRFEIDPAALICAYRLARRPGGLEVLGYWHTHPSGEAVPSARDAASAAPDGRLWLIATHERATLWRAVADGAVQGRFDPVRFDVRFGKRIDRDVPGVQMRAPDRR